MSETDIETVDTKINALTEVVDATIRKELQQAWACLKDAGATAPATVILSRLCILLLDIVYARAGKQQVAKEVNCRSSLCNYIGFAAAGFKDNGRYVNGLGLLPKELASNLHGLRQQANYVDHAQRGAGVPRADACETMYAQYLAALKWVYCNYEHGPKLPDIYTPGCVPATSPPCPIPCALPVEPPCYTPVRDSGEDLDEVDELLSALRYDDRGLVALVGPPGYGKSARVAAALARVASGGNILGESIGAIIYKDCDDGGFDRQWLLRQFGRVFGREDYYVELQEALRQPPLQTIAERALPDLSRRGATWLVLDNFQGLQTESGAFVKETEELLETLLNRGGDVRVLVATRVKPLPAAGILPHLRIFAVDDELSMAGAVALVTALAEKRGAAIPSGEELEEVLEPVGGVPLYLKSLVGYLCDLPGGSMSRLRETEWFARFLDHDRTGGFSKLIHEWYVELPFLQQHLLLSAAVLGVPAPLVVYQEMRPVDTAEEDVQGGLDALCRRFLVKREESGYAANHRQISDILLQMIPAEPPEGASASPDVPEVELSANLRTSLEELHAKAAGAWMELAVGDDDYFRSLGFRERAACHFMAVEEYESAYAAIRVQAGNFMSVSQETLGMHERLQQHLEKPDQQLGNLVACACHYGDGDDERAADTREEIWRRFPADLNDDTQVTWTLAVSLLREQVQPYGERMRFLQTISGQFDHVQYPALYASVLFQQAEAVSTLDEPSAEEKRLAIGWLAEAVEAIQSADVYVGVFLVHVSQVLLNLEEFARAIGTATIAFDKLEGCDPVPDHVMLLAAARVCVAASLNLGTGSEEAASLLARAAVYAEVQYPSIHRGFFYWAARFCCHTGSFDEALTWAGKLAEATDAGDEEHCQTIGLTLAALRGAGRIQEASGVFAKFLATEPAPSAMEHVRRELLDLVRDSARHSPQALGSDWAAGLLGLAASLSAGSGNNSDRLRDMLNQSLSAVLSSVSGVAVDPPKDSMESAQASPGAQGAVGVLTSAFRKVAAELATSNPASLSEFVPLFDAVALICREPELLDKAPVLCAQALGAAQEFAKGLREDSRLSPDKKPTRRRRAATSRNADKPRP